MAAYAALVSLMNLLEQLQRHPQPPVTLDRNQVETLTQKIAFSLDFLEVYNSHYSKPEMEHLRNHIADAAYAAEDVIENHIVTQIRARSTSCDEEDMISSSSADASTIYDEENSGSINLHQVIRDMSIVEKEVLAIKDTLGTQDPQRSVATNVVDSKSTSTYHNTMVGFDDALKEMLHKLTGESRSPRRTIPISGMGGIGKTTLARNVYIHRLTEERFDIRAWITISKEYNVRDILLRAYLDLKNQENWEILSERSDAQIGDMLYKSLFGRRYLVVMDDMWSSEAWNGVKRFFPDQCNGSRIIVTTRLTNVASYLTTGCHGLEMDFLDQDKSWRLFCKTVFGEEDGCPSALKHVGKKISSNCKGLPLSIVAIGGLLAKSDGTLEYWEYIAQNLNSIVNLEDNERCFKILRASYEQLPAHLKACFLYMGFFPKDRKIPISELIRMWVAESFLKPINGKDLEESAEDYLMDLVGRNLIMVHEDELFVKEKFCDIHDLLRNLCIREARKEKFLCVANQHSKRAKTQRRIAIHQNTFEKECLESLNKGGSIARSLICYSKDIVLPLAEHRLLRVLSIRTHKLEDIFRLVNLRYLSLLSARQFKFLTSLSQLWYLQTLFVCGPYGVVAPPEIWEMPLIRHIECSNSFTLPDPPYGHMDGRDGFVLRELRTLLTIRNLTLGEEVIKRIPNITKLGLILDNLYDGPLDLKNLDRLYKLEDLSLKFHLFYRPSRSEVMRNLTFPRSLKKLALRNTMLHWEDISTKIGSLPRLQMLILGWYSSKGPEWKTVEGQFCSLKYLHIEGCHDLKRWTTESSHFPCLECLQLVVLLNLEEIPSFIGDIPTLKSIIVQDCSRSASDSAERILEEQKELGNENLIVRIQFGIQIDWQLTRLVIMGEKKKAVATLLRLVSRAGTGCFYIVKKTKRLHRSNIKLEFRKYDPRVSRHVLVAEAMMK